jgi:hypothetical protein
MGMAICSRPLGAYGNADHTRTTAIVGATAHQNASLPRLRPPHAANEP